MRIAVVRDNESEIAAEILRSVRPVFFFLDVLYTSLLGFSGLFVLS